MEAVKLKGRYIHVTIANRDENEKVKMLLDNWYQERAKKYFQQKLVQSFEKFRRYEINLPVIRLRRMPKRWGTCIAKGVVHLNPDLIKFPAICVEYVIIHELCHLIEANHNRNFYQLLQRIMPDWEEKKIRLEKTR